MSGHCSICGETGGCDCHAEPIPDVEGLVERLERRETQASKYGGFELINPDGPEAADRLISQSQSIRVMREALERIADTPCFGFYGGFRKGLVEIARSALGASGE